MEAPGDQTFPVEKGDEFAQRKESIFEPFHGLNKANEMLSHDSTFNFRMNWKNVNPSLCKPAKDFPLALFNTRFFKAGQIRWNLKQSCAFMNERRLCPRAAQIIKAAVAENGEDPIIYQPCRGAERGRLLSRQRLKPVDASAEPVPYPLLRAPRELILPAPMIPRMKLHLVAFRQDPPDKIGKRKGNIRRGQKRSVEGGSETIETGGTRPDHFLQKTGVFQDLQNGPPRGIRSNAQVEGGPKIMIPQQGKKTGHPKPHSLIGIDIDFQPQNPDHKPPLPGTPSADGADQSPMVLRNGSFSSRKE